MSEERSQALIRDLVDDLEPVRPIPRLRTVVSGVVGLWVVVAAVGVGLRGLRPDLAEALLASRGVLLTFAALGVCGLGGIAAGLALGVPGREAVVRAGLAASALGLAVAAGLGTLLVWTSPALDAPPPLAAHFGCLGVAAAMALLPALGVVGFVARAAPQRPFLAVVAAAAGTAALGAVAAQGSCILSDPRHLLMGHVMAPVLAVLVLALPLLSVLRRLSRP